MAHQLVNRFDTEIHRLVTESRNGSPYCKSKIGRDPVLQSWLKRERVSKQAGTNCI